MTDDAMHEFLGLRTDEVRTEEERTEEARQGGTGTDGTAGTNGGTDGTARTNCATGGISGTDVTDAISDDENNEELLAVDTIPGEESVFYDMEDPPMTVGSTYASMKEFRAALRQHAIKSQFELATVNSNKTRFRGHCKADGCPWAIVARLMQDGKQVRVTLNKHAHFCSSTAKVVTKMASYHWVAEKAIPFLKKEPNMGAKKLQKELQDKYQVTIGYSTVWAGREIAATKIWGTWEDSFGYKGDKKPRGKGLYQVQCKTCKNFGHRASSSKCAFNGTKKRKSRAKQGGPRGPKRKKSQLEAIPNAESNAAPSTPPSTIVHQEPVTGQANCSPGPVTRSQYQLTIHGGSPTKNSPRPKTRSQTHEAGEGSHMNVNTPTKTRKQTTRKANKKLTPRRAKK